MNATTQMEISRYVEQVRAALADLPAPVRDELLEDLPEHLAEVLAEGDGTLVDRLGEPTEYAAELRSSAALDPPAPPGIGRRVSAAWQRTRARLDRVDHRVGPVLGHRTTSEFLQSLRPAWWVLRGYLATALFAYLASGELVGPLPAPGGSVPAGLLVLTVLTIGSVWLGRRGPRLSRWPRRVTTMASALVVLWSATFVLFYLPAAEDPFVVTESNVGAVYLSPPLPSPASPQDVYVYDSQGQLVEGARLFDENGEPILLGFPGWCDLTDLERLRIGQGILRMGDRLTVYGPNLEHTYPLCPERNPFELPALTPSPDTTPAPGPSVPDPSPS
ncbi:HAAS signaling domain-containing protein [Micromonospora sp. LOL_023]|uniref:HAAS signaling domain-containing protein n=1 Tax=Micromonospora sp. LOL_023 TaxID=3345418 RepID=UPI003A89094C